MNPSPLPTVFGKSLRRIHCVGVGGMGLAPLAVYLAQRGFSVTGEDDGLTDDVRRLLAREQITVGPLPADCELVVFSSAIARTHPTAVAAEARGVPRVRRGEMLAEIVRDRRLVAVCGSHGKTTTTALLITALRRAGFPAGYVLGGLLSDETPSASVGSNEWVVAEIDESDGTIERFSPAITVAVNLDWDHPDHYRRLEDLERTFAALFARTSTAVLVSDACTLSAKICGHQQAEAGPEQAGRPRSATFGKAGDFSATIEREDDRGLVLRLGGRFGDGEVAVKARGEFNASNATAALAAARLMGVALTPDLLAEYPGVRRRQAVLHAADGVTVLEDYAHHPAEIRALLASLRPRVGEGGRLVVVFQPHRFSRTAQFKEAFAAALAGGERVYLLDVYPAGEAPVAGGTTADVCAALRRIAPALPVSYFPAGHRDFLDTLARDVRTGDLIAFVGAGDIDRTARTWVTRLKETR